MPVCYIIRGLAGAGKSTLAHKLVPYHRVFSTDDFFTALDGTYTFIGDRVVEAHAWCFNRVCAALNVQEDIAVANCFGLRSHWLPYWDAAIGAGFDPIIVEVHSNFRSVHNPPQHTIERMRETWEPTL